MWNTLFNYMIDNLDINSIYATAQQIVDIYKRELQLKGINASNSLSQSVNKLVEEQSNNISLYLTLNVYWRYIEEGRGASKGTGWENKRADIKQWLINKIGNGTFRPKNGEIPRTDKELERVSYLIGRKISREGFEGKHPLKEALDFADNTGLIDKLVEAVETSVAKPYEQEFDKL